MVLVGMRTALTGVAELHLGNWFQGVWGRSEGGAEIAGLGFMGSFFFGRLMDWLWGCLLRWMIGSASLISFHLTRIVVPAVIAAPMMIAQNCHLYWTL